MIGGTLSFDYALPIPLTLGAEAGIAVATETGADVVIPILARVSWHINFGVPKFDPYITAKLGYTINTGDEWKGSGSSGGFSFGFNAGARYFFTSNVGVFGELGYDRYKLGEVDLVWFGSWSAYYYTFFHAGVTFRF